MSRVWVLFYEDPKETIFWYFHCKDIIQMIVASNYDWMEGVNLELRNGKENILGYLNWKYQIQDVLNIYLKNIIYVF